jgi:DNA processing protein
MDRDELTAWLQLLETPGIGRQTARRLLSAFGDPATVLARSESALAAVVGPALARLLREPPDGLAELVTRTLAWLVAEPGRSILTLGDADYPAIWLQLPDPPLLLYTHGDLALLQRPAVAIVGSRRPTPDGAEHARQFAAALSTAGLTVISGMAEGVDGAAHQGALDAAGGAGRTIAVVGTGLDRVYPRHHHALARRIATEGLLLSEFALGTAPLPSNFPQRNRLIAAHALGTLVVEAALKSGSLITARLASEAGREVFAIPGSIHNPQSRGCHALIRQGAKLVESTQDVLEELRLGPTVNAVPPLGRSDTVDPSASDDTDGPSARGHGQPEVASDPLLEALGWSAATMEVLQLRTGWSASDLSVRLLELELAGHVARLPGQLYQRCAQA